MRRFALAVGVVTIVATASACSADDSENPESARSDTAQSDTLEFRPVVASADDKDSTPSTADNVVFEDTEEGEALELGPAGLSREHVESVDARQGGQSDAWEISINFTDKGAVAYSKLTGEAACNPAGHVSRRIAVVFDGEVISSPEVVEDIPCHVGITGNGINIAGDFTEDEAKDMARRMDSSR